LEEIISKLSFKFEKENKLKIGKIKEMQIEFSKVKNEAEL
jgi:hypothetical protein